MAPVVAKTLWENFFVHYIWPENILTDQGKTFESKLIKELRALAQVCKLCTTPYWPESNGACEWFNSNQHVWDNAQRKQEKLAGLGKHNGSCLQLYSLKCYWVQTILFNVWKRAKAVY